MRRRRGLRRGEPIGSGRAGKVLRPLAAPRRFQSLNGQTGSIVQSERAGAGGAAQLSQSHVAVALPTNQNRRATGSTRLSPRRSGACWEL